MLSTYKPPDPTSLIPSIDMGLYIAVNDAVFVPRQAEAIEGIIRTERFHWRYAAHLLRLELGRSDVSWDALHRAFVCKRNSGRGPSAYSRQRQEECKGGHVLLHVYYAGIGRQGMTARHCAQATALHCCRCRKSWHHPRKIQRQISTCKQSQVRALLSLLKLSPGHLPSTPTLLPSPVTPRSSFCADAKGKTVLGSTLMVLLSADSAALGLWEGNVLRKHKVNTAYTVRKQHGGSQAKYLRR